MDTSLVEKLRQAGYIGELDLETLIEACGDKFEGLNQGGDWEERKGIKLKWHAWENVQIAVVIGNASNVRHFYGETPSEAVANLWLELKGKND